MSKLDKILIIQTAFLGDVILALPMVQTLKNHLPESQIDFLCVPVNVPVISNHPSIRNVIPYDKKGADKFDKFIEVLSEIRENEYDVVISPHRYLRSALLTYYSEAKIRVGFNRNSLSFLLTNKVKYGYDKHEVLRNLDLVKALPGINFDDTKVSLKPELYPVETDEILVNELLSGMDFEKLVTFAPCSRWITKQFPIHKSVEVINMLISEGFNIALIGGNDDREYCRRIENRVMNNKFIKLCGKLTPIQSYLVIKKSKALISVDSAAQHLGAAADIPIVIIYGSTDSSFGFYPLVLKHKIVEQSGLDCRPCTDHGRDKCPLGHFKCMEEIEPDKILNEVKNLIV